jgi:hypothetical protein
MESVEDGPSELSKREFGELNKTINFESAVLIRLFIHISVVILFSYHRVGQSKFLAELA